MEKHLCSNGPFEEDWWLNIVAPDAWKEAIVKDGDELIARLPYVLKNGRIENPKYTQTLGIWMKDGIREWKRGNDQYSVQKDIIHDLLSQLPINRGIDIILDSAQEYILPFRWEGFQIEPRLSYRIGDLSNITSVEAKFSKNIKRDINRGSKILHIDMESNSIDEFLMLQDKTYQRQNRRNPTDRKVTRKIIEETIQIEHGKLFFVRDEDNVAHAGAFILYDSRVCYHLMSGQDTSFGNDGAMPFLIHNEILFARDVSSVFDFEGSMVEGIEQIYRRFGSEYVVNWHVSKNTLIRDLQSVFRPKIKKLIGYKI